MIDSHFLLFPSCIPVDGENSAIMMDLDKGSYIEIPQKIARILKFDLQNTPIKQILDQSEKVDREGIAGYFQYFVDNQYGFYTTNPAPFRKPADVYHNPYKVISSVIAINAKSSFDLKEVLIQLNELSCQLLQIRIYDKIDFQSFRSDLEIIKNSGFRVVEVYLHFDPDLADQELTQLCQDIPAVIIVVHSADRNDLLQISSESLKKIVLTKQIIDPRTNEVYDESLFAISYAMYYESRSFNAGLYRKVCIDSDGSIKNYLSHKKSFGNCENTKLEVVIEQADFQKPYKITNDKIEKCKSCVFRYMCVSNSSIRQEGKLYFKDNYCNY